MLKEITKPILIEDLGMLYATETSKYKRRYGVYKCQCGAEFKASCNKIKYGETKSCGCYRAKVITKHGSSRHPIYNIHYNMMQRTTNPTNPIFMYYGNIGITVCERWKDIKNFIEDMYPTYVYGLSIDRIDNNGNYEPSNCRWTTKCIQSQNTRVIRSNNTSGYRGVRFHKKSSKWISSICINSKSIYLGLFMTPIEAAIAFDDYVIEHNLEHNINNIGTLPESFKGIK